MRVVRVLLSLVLLAFGFVAAMAVLLLGLIASFFGHRSARPAFNVRFQRAGTPQRPKPVDRGDVIDVDATPVKD